MHVMMDDTALSADAPDWFHVPHTTVVNMHQKQVQSLMASYAPVPTHLVGPSGMCLHYFCGTFWAFFWHFTCAFWGNQSV